MHRAASGHANAREWTLPEAPQRRRDGHGWHAARLSRMIMRFIAPLASYLLDALRRARGQQHRWRQTLERPRGKSKARDAQDDIPTYSRQAIHLPDQVRPRRLRGEQERADQENRPCAEDTGGALPEPRRSHRQGTVHRRGRYRGPDRHGRINRKSRLNREPRRGQVGSTGHSARQKALEFGQPLSTLTAEIGGNVTGNASPACPMPLVPWRARLHGNAGTPRLGLPPRGRSTMRTFGVFTLPAIAAAAFLAGCTPTPSPPAQTAPPVAATTAKPAPAVASTALASAVDSFLDGYFEHNPVFAANAGKHEFDGKLPDYSPAGLQASAGWLHAQRKIFAGFTNDQLDAQDRFHRDYVLAVIDGQLFWLEDSGAPYKNPAFYTGDLSPSMYLTRPYAPLAQRMAAFVSYEEALPRALAQIKANLKLPLPASYIDVGVNSFAGYASFFKTDVPGIFAQVKDDALQARFKASNAAAIKASQELADWLKAQKPHATQDFALGADKFAKMLHATE